MQPMHRTRILEHRRGAEQHPVHDAEHRRVGADAESEREDYSKGECLARAQSAERVAQILEHALDKHDAARVTRVVLDALHTAEFQSGASFGLDARQPFAHQLLRLALEMEAQLRVQLALHGTAGE